MNLYLQSFVEQATELQENVIIFYCVRSTISSEILLKPIILCFSADSVARPLLQFRLKFNGYFGCSYCYQEGTFIHTMRYPFEDESSEMRTYESHIRDVQEFERVVLCFDHEVIGRSVLCSLSHLNMVWGFPFDSIHTIFLGVIKHIWELWDKTS